jgi:spermidine synthase
MRQRIANLFLYETVFLTGAAVLIIEVAAVRMLSPFYGSSLYVFSSVLTIILAALALGYYLGGRLSDRMPRCEPLFIVITLSGLLTLLGEVLAVHLLPISGGVFSVVSGPLFFGLILFFLPALLLGIVSPYLVKLIALTRAQNEIGQVAGNVFFWGTLGSITGSLLSGFLLIPLLGIRHTMSGVGLSLVALGLAGLVLYPYLNERLSPFVLVARYRKFLLGTLIASFFLVFLIYEYRGATPEYKVLYESDGVYGHIVVYEIKNEERTIRALKRDTNNESALFLESYDSIFEYMQFAEWYTDLVPEAGRFLMIGGGAYSLPRTILARDNDIEFVVAEIEPDLYPLALEFFDLTPSPRLKNYVGDGRVFLNTNEEPFDVIFLDAFGTDLSIPAHLATHEYFSTVKKGLVRDGVVIMNYIGTLDGDGPTRTGSLAKTFMGVFPNTKIYAMRPEHPATLQNIVFVGRNGDAPISFTNRTVRQLTGNERAVSDLEISSDPYNAPKEIVFTDDRAPIEYLTLKQ